MDKSTKLIAAPIIAMDRHRIQVDGQGVATLVCFQGCPLRCKLCINPFTQKEENEKATILTPEALFEKVRLDELYFLATGGGVTFGGGEPLLYPEFIKQFRTLCGSAWHLCVETSLFVPWENIESVIDSVDMFYFDCKDTDPTIYQKYTGKENAMVLENITKLAQLVPPEKITVRIPLIPGFNTKADQDNSAKYFSELGLRNLDLFTYVE